MLETVRGAVRRLKKSRFPPSNAIIVVSFTLPGIKTRGSCDIQEDKSGSCYCDTASVSPSTVTWSLATDAGPTLHLATCDDVSSCVTSPHANITVTRYSSFFLCLFYLHPQRQERTTDLFFHLPRRDGNGQTAIEYLP